MLKGPIKNESISKTTQQKGGSTLNTEQNQCSDNPTQLLPKFNINRTTEIPPTNKITEVGEVKQVM
jgi:hypothetical protein